MIGDAWLVVGLGLLIMGIVVLVPGLVRVRTTHLPTGPATASVFQTEFIDVGHWRLRVHRSGTGPALLLLHGLGANLYCWRSLVATLNDQYSVIVPDLPGFGQSSIHDGEAYGLDEQAARLNDLLDVLDVSRCFVAGNSMGGNIALWMTLKYPERVRAVAVIAPAVSPRLIPPGLALMTWAAHPLSLITSRAAITWIHGRTVTRRNLFDRERIDDSLATYARQHRAVRSLMEATRAIRDPRLLRALKDLRAPTLILWGSRDRLVSRAVIDQLEHAVPTAESIVHLGGGHHLQEDEPAWTSEKLTQFFGGVQD